MEDMRDRGVNETMLERKKESRTLSNKERPSERARGKHQDGLSRWYRLVIRYAGRRYHESRMCIDGDVEEMLRDNIISEAKALHQKFGDMWADMVQGQPSHTLETPEWLCLELHE